MNSQEYMEKTEQYVLHTYNRFPIVLEKGDGVYLTDADGKSYLDFGAGIAVFALGYGNKAYNDALKKQIDQLIHTSNLYYNIPLEEAAEKLIRTSGMDKVFFTNSGTEAIEGAIKAARKYAWLKDGGTDHEIIAMNHSFHDPWERKALTATFWNGPEKTSMPVSFPKSEDSSHRPSCRRG